VARARIFSVIDHVGINCADYGESQRFYDAVLLTVEAVFHGTLP